MEQPQTTQNYHSNVDTSRPFRSVKEAVAVFGERLLAGDLHCSSRPISTAIVLHQKQEPPPPKPSPSPSPSHLVMVKAIEYGSSNNYVNVESTLKKLEAELEETKVELKMLKERESETEAALATLNAEITSKMAAADARSGRVGEMVMTRVEGLPTLAEILNSVNVGGQRDNNGTHKHRGYGFGENKDKVMVMKKKPIVPLVGDLLFSWRKKKGSSTTLHNPLYSSQVYFG